VSTTPKKQSLPKQTRITPQNKTPKSKPVFNRFTCVDSVSSVSRSRARGRDRADDCDGVVLTKSSHKEIFRTETIKNRPLSRNNS